MIIPRYSLRTLFVFTAATALFASLCHSLRSEPEWIVVYGLLIGGMVFMISGWFVSGRRIRIFVGIALLLMGLVSVALFSSQSNDIGAFSREICVEVYDANSKQPIESASVSPKQRKTMSSFGDAYWVTDLYGKANVTVDVNYSTTESVLISRGEYSFNDTAWRVKARGYRTVDILTRAFFTPSSNSETEPIPPLKVYLEPISSRAPSEILEFGG